MTNWEEEVLQRMLAATETGSVTWRASLGGYESSEGWRLSFVYIERNDGEAFRDVVEISIARVSIHFYRGTVGYRLACGIASLVDETLREHNQQIEERLKEECRRITETLLPHP
ncbi:MAG: hypothetical protein HY319_15145 [Armatimonadetes bacterium]|nr:hypothetical protein [Armatimonadota bacterium]